MDAFEMYKITFKIYNTKITHIKKKDPEKIYYILTYIFFCILYYTPSYPCVAHMLRMHTFCESYTYQMNV